MKIQSKVAWHKIYTFYLYRRNAHVKQDRWTQIVPEKRNNKGNEVHSKKKTQKKTHIDL